MFNALNLPNIAINYIGLVSKTESLCYILVADSMGLAATSLTQYALKPKRRKSAEKRPQSCRGHSSIQSHPRSSILVPVESPYTTSY